MAPSLEEPVHVLETLSSVHAPIHLKDSLTRGYESGWTAAAAAPAAPLAPLEESVHVSEPLKPVHGPIVDHKDSLMGTYGPEGTMAEPVPTAPLVGPVHAIELLKPIDGPIPLKSPSTRGYQPGRTVVESSDTYAHESLKPSFPDVHWEPLTEVSYHDKGLRGHPEFHNLLDAATDVFDYNPKIGTEIHGINLAKLTDAQKDDLARLVSTRGVVFFRDQTDLDIDAQRELGKYFGSLHKHATTSVPKRGGFDDVHVVYTDGNSKDQRAMFTPSFLWHSDVTYEIQPPSYTSLKLVSGPPRGGGGDTLWASQYAAYDVLSSPMQKYLENLTALHSAEMQADGSRAAGRPVRRDPVVTEHPLIRTHMVTGWKSLFFNPGFVTKIVGVPRTESDAIIRYLNEVISTTQELHVRFQWKKNDVAFWDNRVTNHSASYGFAPHRRHAVRVACQAERPYYDPASKSQEAELCELYGLPKVNKDGSAQSNYND